MKCGLPAAQHHFHLIPHFEVWALASHANGKSVGELARGEGDEPAQGRGLSLDLSVRALPGANDLLALFDAQNLERDSEVGCHCLVLSKEVLRPRNEESR